jgi:DNA-binding winged helix-turn-helix (wHTH) protein/Tol biopolymer transport system component
MADPDQPRIIRFGSFEVDKRTGELRKNGSRIKLQEQPLQILLVLLQRSGDIVTREELRQRLWPQDTFVDFDHSLNAAVKRLREALGESADNPVFIETWARRGYRFSIPIEDAKNGVGISAAVPEKGAQARPPRWALLGMSVVVASATLVWVARTTVTRSSSPSSEKTIVERKLTANSAENPIDGGAISPDGTYLAYSDSTGLYLKLIRSGEIHKIALPNGFSAHLEGWLPDGAHVLVSHAERPDGTLGLWNVPIVGGTPRKILEDAWGASVSPDGTRIAFLRGAPDFRFQPWGRQFWIAHLDGSDARELARPVPDEIFVAPAWSRDGRHLAYLRVHRGSDYSMSVNSVELNDLQSLQSRVLFSGTGVADSLCWLPDDRLVYNLQEEQSPQDSNLWAVQVRESSQNSSDPVRLTRGIGWVTNISATTDGNTLEFLRKSWQSHVLVSNLTSDGKQLLGTRQLTLDENNSMPFTWTPDGKAIIFSTDRNGNFDLFTHALDQSLPEPLVIAPDNQFVARLNPAGTELLYQSMPPDMNAPRSIFSIPLAGGAPRLVLRDKYLVNLQCAQLPSTLCVYGTSTPSKDSIRRFDPSTGQSSLLVEIPTQGKPINWSLSPNGSQLAIIPYSPEQNIIQLRSTADNTSRDLVVRGRVGVVTADWSADGNSIFVTTMDSEHKTALLDVKLDGSNHLLMKDDNNSIEWAIPSPDGKLLAINKYTGITNAWSLANF